MHISGWHIDGFGILNDWRVDQLDGGPLIVLGQNEAGKSTLLAFLQGVLFDFLKGRKDSKYVPLSGGAHGGRVFLESPDGAMTVTRGDGTKRSGAVVTLADGTVTDESALKAVLGHTDGTVFRNVFAFSLSELQSFDQLNAEGIREQLFSAGLVGAGRTASAALRDLDSGADALLKPRSGPLRDLGREIRQLEAKLATARASLDGHADLVRREQAAAASADDARQRAKGHEAAAARAELLRRLWPVQVRIIEAEAELADGTDAPIDLLSFEDEITGLNGKAESYRERIAQLETREADLLDTIAKLAPDPAFAANRDAVAAAVADHAGMRDRIEARTTLSAEITEEQRLLDDALARLGPDWTAERARQAAPALADRDALDAARRRRDDSMMALTRARDAETAAQETLDTVRDDTAEADKAVTGISPAPTTEALEEQARRLRDARQALPRAAGRAQEAAQAATALQQAEREADAHPPPATGPIRALPFVAAAILAACAAGFGYAAWAAAPGGGTDLATAIAAGLCIIALAGVLAWIPRLQAESKTREGRRRAAIDARNAAADALRSAETAAADAVSSAQEAFRAAGLSPIDPNTLDNRHQDYEAAIADGEEALAAARTARQRLDRALERQAAAHERLKTETVRYQRRTASREEAEREDAQAEADWRQRLAAHGLPDSLTTAALGTALAQIDKVNDRAAYLARQHERLLALDTRLEAWRRDIAALSAKLIPGVAPQTLAAAFDAAEKLAQRLEEHDANAARRTTQQENLDRVQQDLREIRAQAKTGSDRLEQLAAEAGLDGPDTLPSALETARHRARLRETIRSNEIQRREQIGAGVEAPEILAALQTGKLDEWAETERTEREATDLARGEEDDARTEAVERRSERERIEASADIPGLENKLAGLREAFENGLTEWRVLSLATQLIRDTLGDYQKSRQPAVLQAAGTHFSRVTNGRYRRVLQDPQSDGAILVEPETGPPLGPDALSRGTAEQLYLAMRLGLVADYGARRARLPVIVDDVFVNFDPERARAMAHAFLDLSPDHQVMMFTCHPWVVETFHAIDPTIRVLTLPSASGPEIAA